MQARMLVRQDIFKLSCHSKPNAFAGRDLVGSFLTWNKKEMNTLFFWQVIQKIPLLECKWSAIVQCWWALQNHVNVCTAH